MSWSTIPSPPPPISWKGKRGRGGSILVYYPLSSSTHIMDGKRGMGGSVLVYYPLSSSTHIIER